MYRVPQKIKNIGKRQPTWRYVSELFMDFLRNLTSIQMLNVLGKRENSTAKRVYYGLALFSALCVGYNLSWNIYGKWINQPYLISGAAAESKMDKIPFAAITICSLNQARKSVASKIPVESLEYALLRYACFLPVNFTYYNDKFKQNNYDNNYATFLSKISQPCNEMLIWCNLRENYKCSDLFKTIILDNKLCCVFNSLHGAYMYKKAYYPWPEPSRGSQFLPVNWNHETGYQQNLPRLYTPITMADFGLTSGIKFILKPELDEYYCTSRSSAGYKIIFHQPSDIPMLAQNAITVPVGVETRFRLKVISRRTLPTLRSIEPRVRGCYFNDEKPLKGLIQYSAENCYQECQSLYIYDFCKCLPLYLAPVIDNFSLCEVPQLECVRRTLKSLNDKRFLRCVQRCMPNCHSVTYVPDRVVMPLIQHNQSYKIRNDFLQNLTNMATNDNFTYVHAFYKYSTFRSSVRTPYTTFTKFVSETGSVMSLLIGFSIVFLVELFSYGCMRPFFDWKYKRPPLYVKPTTNAKIKKHSVSVFVIENKLHRHWRQNIERKNSAIRKIIQQRKAAASKMSRASEDNNLYN